MTSENDIQAAVFRAVYQSRRQRLARAAAFSILLIKHALRGMLFSWPLYLLALVPLAIENASAWWVGLFLVPAVLVSGYILDMGVREDYSDKIKGTIISRQQLRQLLW